MDRRSFLTLLGAAALSVVVPEIWTPSPEAPTTAEAIKKAFRVSPPADCIFDIMLCGKSNHSEVATFDVVRPDGTKMLALALNTFGGVLRWAACPGEELKTPLQFVYSGNMTVNVIGRRGDQYSWSVLEPEYEPGPEFDPSPVLIPAAPVIIPVAPMWDAHPALAAPSVPDVFRSAWDR